MRAGGLASDHLSKGIERACLGFIQGLLDEGIEIDQPLMKVAIDLARRPLNLRGIRILRQGHRFGFAVLWPSSRSAWLGANQKARQFFIPFIEFSHSVVPESPT